MQRYVRITNNPFNKSALSEGCNPLLSATSSNGRAFDQMHSLEIEFEKVYESPEAHEGVKL